MLRIGLGQYRTVLDVGRKPLQTGGGQNGVTGPLASACTKLSALLLPSGERICNGEISPIFLPRDAMHKAIYAVVRCLSIRPSVCHVHRSDYGKHILKLLSPSNSATITVLPY